LLARLVGDKPASKKIVSIIDIPSVARGGAPSYFIGCSQQHRRFG
jgi:hypothetical protein